MQSNIVFQVPLKSTGVAYLLWLFFGFVGAHKFYLGKPGQGILYTVTLGLLGIGMIYDLVTMQSQVDAANEKIVRQKNMFTAAPVANREASAAAPDRMYFKSESSSSLSDVTDREIDGMISRHRARQTEPQVVSAARARQPVSFGKRKPT